MDTKQQKIHKVEKALFYCQGSLPKLGFTSIARLLLETSSKVVYQVTKKKKITYKYQRINEALCSWKLSGSLCRKEAERMMTQILVSNKVIKNKIVNMSYNILEQVINYIKGYPMKILQLDEFMNITHCSQLFTVVQYIKNEEVLEHILFGETLKTITKAQGVFNLVK